MHAALAGMPALPIWPSGAAELSHHIGAAATAGRIELQQLPCSRVNSNMRGSYVDGKRPREAEGEQRQGTHERSSSCGMAWQPWRGSYRHGGTHASPCYVGVGVAPQRCPCRP